MLLPISEIIRKSWGLYRTNFKKFTPYILLVLIPNALMSLISVASLYLDEFTRSDALASVNNLIMFAVIVASILFSLWISIAISKSAREVVVGQPIFPIKTAMNASSHLIWPVIWTSLLSFVIILAGTIAFIIPGIIFSVWYAFVYYIVIFEEKKGKEALRLSKGMVKNRWWAIFGRLLGVGLFYGLILLFIDQVLAGVINLIISGTFDKEMVKGAISVITNAIATPLTVLAAIIIYINAKENPVVAPATNVIPESKIE